MKHYLVVLILSLCTFMAHGKPKDDGSQIQPDNYYPRVKMHTTMGDFVVELDRSRAPITVNNFLRYVDKRSYEGTVFHRIIADFVVQGGGYDKDMKDLPKFPDIFNESGNGLKNQTYTIAMARSNGEHTANRQFYFNLNDNESLDPGRKWGYAVFGYVTEGTDVLDAISQVETQYDAVIGWADVPIEPVLLNKVTILPPL
ncbi:peptidylprolyl isomerase [Aliiglaciecola lipolytica]|uniref:Peptidyl-prolyl cis-trans isomerase n=1 Tax=Aliiglaciecola lipolytica E3 TaxID=1127673 RepID=K6YFK2_9ALTE|nr:peptidylprolyl isomerase [Aliiglaciecola lipolytica]GAC16927.1 peptidyl-prolyl cis-trans isomerase A [Aliiglaciecola lipolytica E3]